MDELIKFLEKIPDKWRSRKIKNHPEFLSLLDRMYPGVKLNLQILSILGKHTPFCLSCGKPNKTQGKNTCSVKCSIDYLKKTGAYELQLEKRTKSWKSRTPEQEEARQNKRKSTLKEKYNGNLVSEKTKELARSRSAELNIKGRISLKEKYGVENPSQLTDHKEKCIQTSMSRYNSPHYRSSGVFKTKNDEKRIDRYRNFSPKGVSILNIDTDEEKLHLFQNPNKLIHYKCVCGHEDKIPSETYKWRILNTSTPCNECSSLTKGSIKEQNLKSFVKSLGFNTQENKKILDGKEIDIFIPEKSLGIEFDGLFWHNDLRVDKKYHSSKTEIANKKQIRLIHVFEDEWEHKESIVKDRISYLLGKVNNRVYARNCQIKEIDYEQEKEFLNKNHIQGHAKSSIKVGLFYKGKLVSLMTFSKPNLSKGQKKEDGAWELLRFCSLLNTVVVGGAAKLLNYFKTKYSPRKILSFADKRWSNGDLYRTLGFEQQADTSENYWYIDLKNIKRIHRFNLRKNLDDDQTKTEYENRLSQGYLRIWDCGNSKWIWQSGT